MVCEAPALATVGKLSRIIATVEVDGGHTPLDMVHCRTCVPVLIPVNPEAGEVGVVITSDPETKVQEPVPTAGVFPASVAVVAQTVCVVPALAVVGEASRVIVTVETDEGHAPLDVVH